MGAAGEELSQSPPEKRNQQAAKPPEKSTSKQTKKRANKSAELLQVDKHKDKVFTIDKDGEHDQSKLPKCACHLILNHVPPSKLTKQAKNRLYVFLS